MSGWFYLVLAGLCEIAYQDAEKLIHEFFSPAKSGTRPDLAAKNQSLA